jgi:hypothetical protein
LPGILWQVGKQLDLLRLWRKRCDDWVISGDCSDFGSSAWRTDGLEKFHIGFVVIGPLLRNIILVVDGLNWTNWLTSSAVHTLVWVDVKHAVALIDAIHRAFFNAGFVFQVHAWESNNVSHF